MGFLRTLLALSVVLDHLGGSYTDNLVGGRPAVQLFYVISGFLIVVCHEAATDRYRAQRQDSTRIASCTYFPSTWPWRR